MATLRAGGCLGFMSLVILALLNKTAGQQQPPRTCVNTGLTCIESCAGLADGNYQWCGSCQWFIQCSGGVAYYQPCNANLYWHDDVKACVSVSDTCTECVIHTSPNGLTDSTIRMTTIIASLCESTGPDCIEHCDVTHNGVYQWCARCDYFLLCSGSEEYYMACPPDVYYDHTVEACVYNSTTCRQCYDGLLTTPTPIDACASGPCLNGGTCSNIGVSFDCNCPTGWTGPRCETRLEGSRLFILTFMRITTTPEPNLQEIFIKSSESGRVKVEYHSPLYYTEVIELNSTNNFQYVKRIMPTDLGSPINGIHNTAIVVSSEMDISVQANKASPGSGDGYLALPITEQSVSFFLASYSVRYESPTFSVASPFNDTRVSISYVRGNSSDSLLNLTLQANDVYQAGYHDLDYTGVYVASSRPIAVFSGHMCANVPVSINFCDHLVEQVPPVGQWGLSFIMASFYGRPWAIGYWIRVIAQIDTNVTYTYQSFDANNNPSTWSIFRTVTLVRGEWDEASIEGITATNAIVVMVNCTFDCLVMQYNPGAVSNEDLMTNPDPFMVTVPPLNHYPQDVRFSTSRNYYDEIDRDYVSGITIVAKTDDVNMNKIYLDGIPLTSIGGTTYSINADGYSDYSVIIAPLTPGFHSVTSNDPNAYYAVFVYGYATIPDVAAYGYLGGYRYLSPY